MILLAKSIFFVPDQAGINLNQVPKKRNSQKTVGRTYKQSRKKAKRVDFSEFRKKYPVLKVFSELDEPKVPTNVFEAITLSW